MMVAYVRVSTGQQDVSSQKQKLQDYANSHGLQIDEWFIDDAISGTEEERPSLLGLKEWARHNPGGKVLCLGIDRTARDMFIYVTLERHLAECNVTTEYLGFQTTGNIATDTLLKNVLASFAAYELEVIKERMNRGKRYLLKNGIMVSGGQPPYGYCFEGHGRDKKLVIDEQEAEIVRQIFKLYAEDNYSISQIADYLTKQMIKPSKRGRARNGTHWAISSLNHILHNKAYVGTWTYGKTKTTGFGKNKKEKARPINDPDGLIELTIPPIIRTEQFNKAQARSESRSKKWGIASPNKKDYLLKGLLRCSICKYKIVGTGSNTWWYYRCGSWNHIKKPDGKRGCGNTILKGEYVEALILRELCILLSKQGTLRLKIKQMVTTFTRNLKTGEKRYLEALDEMNKLIKAKEKLLDLLSRGMITEDEYKSQGQKYQNELINLAVIIRERDELINSLKKFGDKEILKNFTKIANRENEELANAMDNKDKAIIRKYFVKYIEYITVFPDRLEIKFTIPTIDIANVTTTNSPQHLVSCNNISFLTSVKFTDFQKSAHAYTHFITT